MPRPWRVRSIVDPLDRRIWFGVHAGETFAQVLDRDPDYIEWLLYESEMDLDEDLVERLELVLSAIGDDEDWGDEE